jgi:hypothetical protein
MEYSLFKLLTGIKVLLLKPGLCLQEFSANKMAEHKLLGAI